jgi:hypothetical protein
MLPRLQFGALQHGELQAVLERHGFALLSDLPADARAILCSGDKALLGLFSSCVAVKRQFRTFRRTTRARNRCASLPLAGLGHRLVCEGDNLVREQVHFVTDRHALALLPWPTHRLRCAVEDAASTLHSLACQLLGSLDGGCYDAERKAQAQSGDPSVLDAFLYPNVASRVPGQRVGELDDDHREERCGTTGVNMRAHVDPGLLTLTMVSDVPGSRHPHCPSSLSHLRRDLVCTNCLHARPRPPATRSALSRVDRRGDCRCHPRDGPPLRRGS